MGSGRYNVKAYHETAKSYATKDRSVLFQKKLIDAFNPLKMSVRESCASAEHPNPTSIIITCDVTGSMGQIPEDLLKGGLGKIMESLLQIKSISNPQVMFAAIGDTEYDTAPLQVTQFESDNRIESQLKDLYLESGGGGNSCESYNAIWYFAAYKTKLDSLSKGKKGLLFTIGDELMPTVLKGDHIRKFIDPSYKGSDITTANLLNEVSKKYEVFHLLVNNDTYRKLQSQNIDKVWKEYLGQRVIFTENYKEIPEKIIVTVKSICETYTQAKSIQSQMENIHFKNESLPPEKAVAKASIFKPSPSVSALLNKDNDEIPELFKCPIGLTVMEEPVMAEDGYSYERKNILAWFEKNSTSPVKNIIIGKLLIDNHSLKSEIQEWKTKQATFIPANILK
jgi:hypothetical protein